MKFLQRLKIWRELKRLEERLRQATSPTTYVDLGQVYINLGTVDKALRVSEEGLAEFPNSEELRKLNKFVKRFQLKGRIKDLRAELNKTPDPQAYQELAALYLELGDLGAVHGTCEESIRRFPDDPGSHLLLARARLGNFYRDRKARDGMAAVQSLDRVLSLEPRNSKAHKLLAEVLYRVGAVDRTVYHLRQLRELSPDDLEADTLLRSLLNGPRGTDGDLEEMFAAIESNGRMTQGPIIRDASRPTTQAPDNGVDSIREALARLAEIKGVSKAAYVRGTKALIKGDIQDGADPFLRMARVVAKAAQRTCRRIDLGNFNKGILDGDFGHVCVCSYGEVVAAVLCETGSAVDPILGDLQELVAQSLAAEGVTA